VAAGLDGDAEPSFAGLPDHGGGLGGVGRLGHGDDGLLDGSVPSGASMLAS
jgi:hypothetical protein